MITQQLKESEDFLSFQEELKDCRSVKFTKDVTVKTWRFESSVLDGVHYHGELDVKAGAEFRVMYVERGEKRRPCRLCTIGLASDKWSLVLEDVPEDSFDFDERRT